jgi:hypothetical protein
MPTRKPVAAATPTPRRSRKAAAEATVTPIKSRRVGTARVAAPVVDVPSDPEAVARALKSAKGSLWMMTHKRAQAPSADALAAQEAKIAALQSAWEAVRPPRAVGVRQTGPSWVVTLDAATGAVRATYAADPGAASALAAAARDAGLWRSTVAATGPAPTGRRRRS